MDPRIRITLRLMSEHNPSVDFPLAQASKWLGLSEPYITRLFHREVGKTVRQHLLELRMSNAARLLKDYSRPIKRIALECGYSDISNFYRDFKTVHAITPKELRLRALASVDQCVGPRDGTFPQHSSC